jgi:hypothetical protein
MRTKKTNKRIEITVETERVLIVRRGQGFVRGWCEACAAQVKMASAGEAASVAGVSQRTIYRWVETEKLHFSETPEGWLLICLNSLPK